MRKYWHVLNIGIQNTLVYRVNFLFRALFGLIPLVATISLWRAIYAGQAGDVAGYSLAQMISYYLVITIVDSLTAVNEDDWQIATDIKDGNISQFLLKPIDYLAYRLCLFGAGRLVYTLVALVPVALFIFCQRRYFILPADGATLAWFVASIVLTALLQFFLSYTMALLAFLLHAVSVPVVFPSEHLHRQNDGRGAPTRVGNPSAVGHRGVRAGAPGLVAGHPEILRGRRLMEMCTTKPERRSECASTPSD